MAKNPRQRQRAIVGILFACLSCALCPPMVGALQTPEGFARRWLLLGHYIRSDENLPGQNAMRADYLTDGNLIRESTFYYTLPTAGLVINTDFAIAASQGYNSRARGFAAPTVFLWKDSDDTIDFDEAFGEVDYCMTYAWVLARNKTGRNFTTYLGIGYDDSIQVIVNGVEVGINNAGRWHGGNNTIQDAWGPIALVPGNNVIMVKVFEGHGGTGLRLRLQTNNQTGAATTANAVSPDLVELTVPEVDVADAVRQIAGVGLYQVGDTFDVTITAAVTMGNPSPTVTETAPWDIVGTPVVSQGNATARGSQITLGRRANDRSCKNDVSSDGDNCAQRHELQRRNWVNSHRWYARAMGDKTDCGRHGFQR